MEEGAGYGGCEDEGGEDVGDEEGGAEDVERTCIFGRGLSGGCSGGLWWEGKGGEGEDDEAGEEVVLHFCGWLLGQLAYSYGRI